MSIIVPCHNVADTLGEQLAALAAQAASFGGVEVIVVDNGSVDGTRDVALAAADGFERLRVVDAHERQGASFARNRGVDAASSARILFCDGDDVVARGWLVAHLQALNEHAIVTGPLDTRRLNADHIASSRGAERERSIGNFAGVFPIVSAGNLSIARSVYERVGGFDESVTVTEDIALSFELWRIGVPVHFEPRAAVHYRYRSAPRDLFRQGLSYGRNRPRYARRLRRMGGRRVPRFPGLRSWAWLAMHAPLAVSSVHRPAVAWVAGNRLGQVLGSIEHRSLQL